MSIEEFNGRIVDTLIEDMRIALEMVAKQHGLKLKRKNCRYRSDSCPVPFLFEAVRLDEDGMEETVEMRAYKRYAMSYDLRPEWLGEWVTTTEGYRVQVVGLKIRNRKYPVLAKTVGGMSRKMTAKLLRDLMRSKEMGAM